ncbi:Uncharacterized protein APZ42_031517 [Daphnia magna]|uniref:Reverse transcriptase domain-containing protein n=1 Tax=Daphnia magna TaxID=35525 RepID=A0A164MSQ6_9CRUS|nr:Uncharacterized protein APZ42_031517 [Daphnia magna]
MEKYHLQEITKLASFDSFGGQIVRFVPEWSIFTKDPRVLSTVSMGFKLEFLEQPFQSYPSPNSVMNKQLCDQEIGSLLQKGATVKAGGPGFISSIFLIPKKSGRCRRIINLKNLYRFLVEQPFKMEGFSTIRHTIRQREWLAKLDLKDACLTIPVFEGHRKFLQFFWKDTRYEFEEWDAPHHLSRLHTYSGDFSASGQAMVYKARSTLETLGFIISKEKSIENPTQTIEYIGLVINTVTMKFTLPAKKISDIQGLCTKALK